MNRTIVARMVMVLVAGGLAGCRTPAGETMRAPQGPDRPRAEASSGSVIQQAAFHPESPPPPEISAEPPEAVEAGVAEPGVPEPGVPESTPPGRHVPPAWNLEEPLSGLLDAKGTPLRLEDVKASVLETYPALRAAMLQGQVAAGQQLAAMGEFDLKLKADSLSAPLGFYKTYRNAVKGEQATWNGGSVFGQYRIGDGNFQPWFGERETNEGGEFKVGGELPFLRGRAIDDRRAAVFQAAVRQQAVEPFVQGQVLEFIQFASRTYWSWVAAGQTYRVNRELLHLTQERNAGIARRVELQDLAALELRQNERLIASREAKLLESERKLQQSAIKLSLFLRERDGLPLLPSPSALPPEFPPLVPPAPAQFDADLALALDSRPEFRDLTLQSRDVEIELANARNQLLPGLSAGMEASKDVGAPASSKGDKTPFELEAGVFFDLPVQRRKARGKILATEAKLAQITAKRELVENKVRAELQDAYSAMHTAHGRWRQARISVQLARELQTAERRKFDLGDSDLIRVALQEQATIEAALVEIEAQSDFFQAQADYQATLANP